MPSDSFGDPIVQSFPFAVATGSVAPGVIAGRSVGYVTAATLNVTTNILASTYAQQASAAQRSLSSSSTLDTAAGTGARTITINYLNNSMVLKQDTVTLNGTTAVNTNATDIQFIESMVVATSGTDVTNDGAITMFTGTAGGGSAMAVINALDSSTFYAHHYVPAGVSCYIIKHTGCGTLAAGRTLMVHVGDPRSTNPTIQVGDIIIHLAGGSEDHQYEVPLVIAGPDRIIMRENPIATAAGNIAYASFDYVQY